MSLNSITNLAITWGLFKWSKQGYNIRLNYLSVHLFIIIMDHDFKFFDESLFKDFLSVASCFKIKVSKFWEPHCILILSQYLVEKSSIYYWNLALFVVWFRSLFFSNFWRFLRSSITLRRYLLPNIILEKYAIFSFKEMAFKNWNQFIFN